MRVLLLCCAVLTLVPGADYVVWSEKGNDKNPGTKPETAWKTLAQAASRAGSGDTVHLVRGSVFREVPSFRSGVTIAAVGPERLPAPAICGSVPVRGWKAWSENKRIMVASCDQTPEQLYVDNQLLLIARYPDTGWLNCDGADNDSITDADLAKRSSRGDYWKGGQVRWRKWSWWYETRPITGSSADRLRLGGQTALNHTGKDSGYYIDNLLSELDAPGEWYYDAAAKQLYCYPPEGVDLDQALVEAAVVAKGPGSSELTWKGICFRHFTGTAMTIGRKTIVDGCIFENIGDTGIGVNFHGFDTEIMNSTFRDIHNGAISWNQDPANTSHSSRIHHNRFERIGTIPGYGGSGVWHSAAIKLVNATKLRVDHNRIFGAGYAGIILGSDGNIVERNVFKDCMATLNDGAAIYANCNASVIRENVILDTEGDLESSHSWYPLGHGIWPEFLSDFKDSVIVGNTVCGSGGFGLFLTNNYTCEVKENVFFDNLRGGMRLEGRNGSNRAQNHTIEGNYFVCRGDEPTEQPYATQFRAQQAGIKYDAGINYGSLKDNVFSDTTAQRYVVEGRSSVQDLASWQQQSWGDKSAIVPKGRRKPNSGEKGLPFCFINDSDEARDVPLPGSGKWVDLHGQSHKDSVRIEPWRSVVLILASGSSGGMGPYMLASGDDRATVAEAADQVAAAPAGRKAPSLKLGGAGGKASADTLADWESRTIARIAELVKGGTPPSFNMRRMDFAVIGIDASGGMQVEAKGMKMQMSFASLKDPVRADLGVSMAKVGKSELDHALAAFWLINAKRQTEAAEQLMEVSGELSDAVRSAFAGADDGV